MGGQSGKANAADELVAAIVKFEMSAQFKNSRLRFEKSLVSGLKASGFHVIDRQSTLAKLGPASDFSTCTSEVCLLEAVRLTGASHLVQAVVTSDAKAFSVAVTLVEGVSGATFAESLRCGESDPCPPIPMALERAAKGASRKAKRQAEMNPVVPEKAEPPKVVEKPVQPTEPTTAPLSTPAPILPPPVPSDEARSKTIGWAAVGVGSVLSVVGLTYLIYFDGRETDCTTTSGGERCQRVYEDTSRGIVTGLLGAAALGVGVYFLWPTSHDPSATQVSVGMNNVSLIGKF